PGSSVRIVNYHQGSAATGIACGCGKVSRAPGRESHVAGRADAIMLDQIIEIVKEKALVLSDGTADRAAEIVASQRRQRVVAPPLGVELVISEKLVRVPMELIRAAASDRVDHAPVGVSELRAEAVDLDFEFLHGFHRRGEFDAIGSDPAAA